VITSRVASLLQGSTWVKNQPRVCSTSTWFGVGTSYACPKRRTMQNEHEYNVAHIFPSSLPMNVSCILSVTNLNLYRISLPDLEIMVQYKNLRFRTELQPRR
jgi:hypothetical protein